MAKLTKKTDISAKSEGIRPSDNAENENGNDTAAALCTAPGGALSVIRITGENALSVAEKVWTGRHSLSASENLRKMLLGKVCGSEPCLAVYMKAPHSYTGDDTVELQCHGGAVSPGRLLQAVFDAGARQAEPGEFTKRAFLNGKLDLTQAEAVADLIGAKSNAAADLALKQLSGVLGRGISRCRADLMDVLAEIESRMDFPEEDLNWKETTELAGIVKNVMDTVRKLIASRERGQILREGVRVVIAGRPNSGKSSLLNALLGYDRAIVTAVPGTTRDTLEEFMTIRGIPVRLTDTAGMRDETADEVEKIGIARSKESLRSAEVVLWVADTTDGDTLKDPLQSASPNELHGKRILVWNKSDLPSAGPLPRVDCPSVLISAKECGGLEELMDVFRKTVLEDSGFATGECEVSLRHASILEKVECFLEQALPSLEEEEWDLAASSLHSASGLLGEITGESVSPDILDEIFSRFCIGK